MTTRSRKPGEGAPIFVRGLSITERAALATRAAQRRMSQNDLILLLLRSFLGGLPATGALRGGDQPRRDLGQLLAAGFTVEEASSLIDTDLLEKPNHDRQPGYLARGEEHPA